MRAFHIFLSLEKGAAYMPDQDPNRKKKVSGNGTTRGSTAKNISFVAAVPKL
jgi:hypothetical protein